MTPAELQRKISSIERKLKCLSCETNFYENVESFPTLGKFDRLYVDTTENKIYIWEGSSYVSIGGSEGVSLDKATQLDVDSGTNDSKYITPLKLKESSQWDTKQDILESGTNIKTINGNSILGSGDIDLIDDTIVDGELKAPSQNAVFDAFALRDAINSTGTVISFNRPIIYNSVASPGTTNITEDLTNAKIGIVQKIYHNHSSAPTFPGTWVLLGSNSYQVNELNIIFAEWVGSTRVEYWIIQEN
ncbi:hypothetical protein [Leptolyngbya phage Lbo-JY46]